MYRNQIPIESGVDTTVTSDGEVTWVGRLQTGNGDLRVTQQTSIYDGDATTLGLEVTVTLENAGDTELSNLCYSRNVDPDQEQVSLTPPPC